MSERGTMGLCYDGYGGQCKHLSKEAELSKRLARVVEAVKVLRKKRMILAEGIDPDWDPLIIGLDLAVKDAGEVGK